MNADALEAGWALVAKEPWRETLNQSYGRGQDAAAAPRGRAAVAPPPRSGDRVRRARLRAARGTRLLEDRWDWSSTQSHDGGLVNVGRFGDTGLDVLSYSKAVKHGALGICPTLVGTARG